MNGTFDRRSAWGLLTEYARSANWRRQLVSFRRLTVIVLLSAACLAQPAAPTNADATALLDKLAGHWVLSGRLGSKQTTHDVDAEWILKREYLRLHEVSREKDANGAPAYEAFIFFEWDPKAGQYNCLWLDNTEGGGLSVPIVHGKKIGDSISLIFGTPPSDGIHTVFRYDAAADAWALTIDNIVEGKEKRFGDVRLTRGVSPGS